MDLPAVVSRDEWLAARTELLAEEKALTGPGPPAQPYIDDFKLHDTYTPADLAGTATAH